ncbi:hypothetical protein T492DRAFT_1018133 [Pavlovales sp. CCMP2436]|nr:hypothetical protein T492DRAFT_1018133 [Pavlovales sp. CCMP2436]
MSAEHLETHWLPRLGGMGALEALSLEDCAIDRLRQLYALLPYLPRLRELTLREGGSHAAGVGGHPLFRQCAVSLLPLLHTLNGEAVAYAERGDAERRCAALNRLALEPPSRDSTAADASLSVSSQLVSAVLQHALAIDAKLRALNAAWPDALGRYVASEQAAEPKPPDNRRR